MLLPLPVDDIHVKHLQLDESRTSRKISRGSDKSLYCQMERQISGEKWPMTFELKYGMKKQSSSFLFLDAPGSLQTSVVAEEAGDWGTFRMIVARKPQIAF